MFDPVSSLWSLHILLFSCLFTLTAQLVEADGYQSMSLVLLKVLSCEKDVLPSHCHQVLTHRASSDVWGSLSGFAGFLAFNGECHEMTDVVFVLFLFVWGFFGGVPGLALTTDYFLFLLQI